MVVDYEQSVQNGLPLLCVVFLQGVLSDEIGAEGIRGDKRIDGLTLGFQCRGVIHTPEAVARICMDVCTLSFQLTRLEGDDIDVALRKKRLTARIETGLFRARHWRAGGNGAGCWLWFCHDLPLACYFPVLAIAALFETSNYLSEMGFPAIFADEAMMYVGNEMDMLRHDYIVLYLNDWIVGIDAVEQFMLHHLSNSCQFHSWGIGVVIRELCITNDSA